MESWWFLIVLTLCISFLLKSLLSLISTTHTKNKKKLPPGPAIIPIVGRFLWLKKSFSEIQEILQQLIPKYGPIISINLSSRNLVFIAGHSIAHRTLVQNGALFSDRPKPLLTNKILSANQHNISSAAYGPTWRLLRRNLTAHILHPTRLNAYSHARKWVLAILIKKFAGGPTQPVGVMADFQYGMFCLLVLMCFGDKLREEEIREIEKVQRELLVNLGRFSVLNLWTDRVGKFLYRRRWREFFRLIKARNDVLVPLIKARTEKKKRRVVEEEEEEEGVVAYVDTLLDLKLSEEGDRELSIEEMVSLCGEFLNAGTDTTSTALEWIMANLVKYPGIQDKVYQEIAGVVGMRKRTTTDDLLCGGGEEEMVVVEEEDLHRMSYLKAVVLEALRRHPPAHFVLPHRVSEDFELEGYVVPKNATVNFMVAEMGRDGEVWKDPMEFKPERFLKMGGGESKIDGVQGFDITGSREIKMMPFGAGRRICPGFGLAMLHLEYFVANFIWYFEWKPAADDDIVDLAEKQVFTVVMKNPLRARISPRPLL